jgi:DNA segregation ATPase FtsK/SpoIIIE, S-DNA-T family
MDDLLPFTEEEPLTLRPDDWPQPIKPKAKRAKKAAAPKAAEFADGFSVPSKRSTEAPTEDKAVFHGAALVVIAALFFLSLFSYDTRDLPTWAQTNSTGTQNPQAVNCMGLFGAFICYYSQMIVGSAIYLVPLCMTWFGVCKIMSHARVGWKAILAVPLLTLCGACIFELGGFNFSDDPISGPPGPGGALGRYIGGTLLTNVFGRVGGIILTGGIYTMGLIFVTGMRPMAVISALRKDLPILTKAAIKFYRQRYGRQADGGEVTPDMMDLAIKPRSRAKPVAAVAPVEEEPARSMSAIVGQQMELNMPQIIDSSAPRQKHRDDSKPPLAEVWASKRQAKLAEAGGGPAGVLAERFKDYQLPPLDLFNWPDESQAQAADPRELIHIQETILRCLDTFGIKAIKGDITRGPAITRYEVLPEEGTRMNRVAALDMDIARATKAERINILAPIPGKDTVGIELANRTKVPVPIRELLEDEVFQNGKAKLPVALGKDVYGHTIIADLAAMPHLLVAGATGSGKSVCINGIITSLIARFAPDELRFVMIDPKVVEMQVYAQLPHLALPVVTDPKKALMALRWVVKEMETRYRIFADEGVRNFESFNNRTRDRAARKAASLARKVALPKSAAKSQPVLEAESVVEAIAEVSAETAAPSEQVLSENLDDIFDFDQVDLRSPLSIAAPINVTVDNEDVPPWDEEPSMPEMLSTHEEDSEILAEDDSKDEGLSSREALTDANGDWAGDSYPPDRPHKPVVCAIPDVLPFIVVIIDELADLMQTAPADIEQCIARITQMARAAGIHLIIATQTPRADVITGVIKANVPSRIAFQVASAIDSRVILDRKGAENLVGKGDMLYLPPGTSTLVRSQGALVTDDEIHGVVEYCAAQGTPLFDAAGESMGGITPFGEEEEEEGEKISSEDLNLVEQCLDVIRVEKKASTSLFQRRLNIGYGKAARMMDILEDRGIIGPPDGQKLREILVALD